MSSTSNSNTTKKVIREYLLADSDIVDLVGDRVFTSHIEDADEANGVLAEGPMLVFEFLSGSQRAHGSLQGQTFELYGYSKASSDEASQAYDLANERMHEECCKIPNIPMAGVTREIQRPVAQYNRVLRAWFMRGRWTYTATG